MKVQGHSMVNIGAFGFGSVSYLQIAVLHLGFDVNGHSKYAIAEQDILNFRKSGRKGLRFNSAGYHVFSLDGDPTLYDAVINLLNA